MAPRPSLARRTLAPQGEHIYELGVVGRKTGVTVPDSGVRDEHGMEPIEDLFSSPGKSDEEHHAEREEEEEEEEEEDDYGSGEEAMDITTGSGITPAALLNGHGSRLPVAMGRVRSPAKTLLNSPAQRNRLIARNSSSPARGTVVRDDGNRSSSQPTGSQGASKRRLDFGSVVKGGPHSLSQPLPGRPGLGKGLSNGHRLQPLAQEEEEEEEYSTSEHGADDEVNDFVEESMAMLNDDDDYDLPAPPEPEPAHYEEEEIDDEDSPTHPARKKPGRPAKEKEAAPAKPGRPAKKAAKAFVQEEEDTRTTSQGGQGRRRTSTSRTRKQEAALPRRGRTRGALPNPTKTPAHLPATTKKAPTKKAAPAIKKTPTTTTTTPKPKPKPKIPAGRKPKVSLDPGDTSQISIARRPPLPKSRGLLINRREVPGDGASSMFRTRSGRTSMKPLAYWRNERVEFDKDEAEDAFRGRTQKGRIVLPSVKEVVRVDEPEPEFKQKEGVVGGRRLLLLRGGEGELVWELDPGTVTGEVVVWQPEYDFAPPAPNDMVSVMDKQLAISGAAIKTTEVVGGEFRYAKVFSEGFIGAGVVDLPPGAIKRLKNSRKVFMIFFVHAGRVLVTVQETSFRISKGGIFIVPRYNEYTIENDYDNPARIFFAQGQEVAVKPLPEEPEGYDVDEEAEISEGEEGEEEEGSEEGEEGED
ncbi:mitotic fidelity of chromosome transmission- protein [Collariella sp. IMI 366227]|nr:mitotic fidelity of chromosome transmission- protein [Collariella sp. IMI 366227]